MGIFASNLGGSRFVPVMEDYDGDQLADPAVFRARTGSWVISLSSIEYASVSESGLGGPALGAPSYASQAADYDGDGMTDPAVYQAKTGNWYLWLSDSGYSQVVAGGWGGATWTPVPADYDGDACMDPAVYQQSAGHWMVWLSSFGYTRYDAAPWGGSEFVPVQAY